MRVRARVRDPGLRVALDEAVLALNAELIELTLPPGATEYPVGQSDVVVVEMEADANADVDQLRADARRNGAALLIACPEGDNCPKMTLAESDDWVLLPTTGSEMQARLVTAQQRAVGSGAAREKHEAAELIRYEELLYDKLTGFPTLPVMIERARDLLERRNELTVLYIHFVWYEKIEEIYGWQKLDDVLETTAAAVRDFYSREHAAAENLMMVSHIADDDFILFTEIPASPEMAERRLRGLSERLE
ncbi:MAG: hypothetical protein ACREMQ_07385, partial [Longimicrobiales bacterium]